MLQGAEHSRQEEVDSGYRIGRALPDVGERRRTAVKVPLQAALLSEVLTQYLSFVTALSVLLPGFINEDRNCGLPAMATSTLYRRPPLPVAHAS